MNIALASPPFPRSIADGLYWVDTLIREAASLQADIICFPESYIPGYRGDEFDVEAHSASNLQQALNAVCKMAKANNMAVVLPMDWDHPDGILNVAYAISKTGEVLGYQSKNQLDPSEDSIYIPGTSRSIFEVDGVKFGITICHEGFRYPESVRWAARQGAQIVFHPTATGSNVSGKQLVEWGNENNPYYEKAAMLRAMENTIYFGSVTYAMRFQESTSALIAPDGKCIGYQDYGKPGVFVVEINPQLATGLLARRFKPEFYD